MTQKKCLLCSQLSSKFNKLFRWIFGIGVDCQGINLRTFTNKLRVAAINADAPDCACEKYRMSTYSPCTVEDTEILARFVFSPIQIDKKGRFKPAVFSHVHNRGCSIQRESIAEIDHAFSLVQGALGAKEDAAWQGVLLGQCRDIRKIMAGGVNRRAICVYDTADSDNPAHGELCQTQHIEEADQAELRHDLLVAFGNGSIIPPLQYKNGAVWDRLPGHFQARG